ncbi:MAG: hypothetical protein LBK63_03210 [Treponema sp.]|jgi:hypothetical protein|nr:hypothetical protein [Treponema sp.]
MKIRNAGNNNTQWREDGYTPKGMVTAVIKGELKTYPVSEVKITPPKKRNRRGASQKITGRQSGTIAGNEILSFLLCAVTGAGYGA